MVRTLRDGSTVVVVPPRLDVSPFSVPFLLNASSLMLVAGGVFSAVEASKNRAWAPAASAAAAAASAASAAAAPRAGGLLDRAGWLALGAGCAGIAFAATNSTTARDNVRRTMRLTTGIDYLVLDAEYPGILAFMYACAVVPLGTTIEPCALGHCAVDVATTAAALALPPLLAATAGVRALRPGRTERLDAAEMRRWAALGHQPPQEALKACAFGIAIKLLSLFVPPRTFVITPSRWFWEPREESDEERRNKLRRRRWLHQYDDDEENDQKHDRV